MVAAISKAGLEAEVARVVSRFHEDQHGCKPELTSAYILDDMVLVKLEGCFTPTERNLTSSTDGRKIVKSARIELRSLTRRQIEAQIGDLLGATVLRSFWDLDVRVGQQVEVYMLEKPLAMAL